MVIVTTAFPGGMGCRGTEDPLSRFILLKVITMCEISDVIYNIMYEHDIF